MNSSTNECGELADDRSAARQKTPTQRSIRLAPAPWRAQEDYGKWLDSGDWGYFPTLTFKPTEERHGTTSRLVPVSDEYAFEAFRCYARDLERCTKEKLHYIVVAERGSGGMTHLHALVAGEKLSSELLETHWLHGNARAPEYVKGGGAAYYIMKDIDLDSADFRMSDGPFPWD